MDIVFWIILIVVAAAVIWWLLNRNKSANPPGASTDGPHAGRAQTDRGRTDGALEGGSAAASAQAAGTTGIPTAAGFGKPAEPAAPATAEEPADSVAGSGAGSEVDDRRGQDQSGNKAADKAADQAEWETQWSEAGAVPGPAPRSGSSTTGASATPVEKAAHAGSSPDGSAGQASAAAAHPVHHDEYTAPHAPTLPGAETAAVESADDAGMAVGEQAEGHASRHQADASGPITAQERTMPPSSGSLQGAAAAETLDRAQSSALVENGADHREAPSQEQGFAQDPDLSQEQGITVAEPAGHLAADEPYGAGSAAPGPDGSGPADYTVKGDAAAMVYYEEGHPDYEQTRAEVWFESAAHAEAAGFRAPRRKRL